MGCLVCGGHLCRDGHPGGQELCEMASQPGVPAGPKETERTKQTSDTGRSLGGGGDTSSAKAGDLKNLIKHPSPNPIQNIYQVGPFCPW